jgi:hypothetical protein
MNYGKTFFLSFVEECVMDPAYSDEFIGGRIEVYEIGSEKYAIEEIRFLTKNQKEYHRLREKWDFEDATAKELERLRAKITALNGKN